MKLLTQHRERLGWSKSELARRTGMHPTQIGQFEAGRLVPYPSQVRRMAEALGVAAEMLCPEMAAEAVSFNVEISTFEAKPVPTAPPDEQQGRKKRPTFRTPGGRDVPGL